MSPRPPRLRVRDELGRQQALADGAAQFTALPGPGPALILGLGPDPAQAAALVPAGRAVYCMEPPEFKAQAGDSWTRAIPAQWKQISPEDLGRLDLATAHVLLYGPSARLFPSFWGPALARVRAARLALPAPSRRSLLLPMDERGLLGRELEDSFRQAGWAVRTVAPAEAADRLPALLREEVPDLYLSVNLAGLDPLGEAFYLLRQAGCAVAAWCVDNPWHLLSGLRAPFWKELPLALTDASFAPGLRAHGAANLLHLPLAAWPGFFERDSPARPGDAGLEERLVFVGRSAFPQQEKFFAGCELPEIMEEEAKDCLAQGRRPDFHWWTRGLGLRHLWPGASVRNAGFGADLAGRAWRAAGLLTAAQSAPLTVYGDAGWRELLPRDTDLRGPVDYYGPLAGIYARSGAVLNLTGLLLPAGLNQRHFDVWAAGGFLISDAFPGLDLFPRDLVDEMRFKDLGQLAALARRALRHASWRRDLSLAWRQHILEQHTYAHRVQALLDWLGLA